MSLPINSLPSVDEAREPHAFDPRSLRCSAPQCDVVARLCVVRGAGGAGGAEGVLGWLGDLADPRQLGAGQSVPCLRQG